MSKPRLLDLFCGAGGAAVGYSRAGFEVVGVDIKPQPHYPFEFIQADALKFLASDTMPHLPWDAIHASPPCQAYSAGARMRTGKAKDHPKLIEPVRDLLEITGLPYVIENVPEAPLRSTIILCGSLDGLDVRRHRAFESNILLFGHPCMHDGRTVIAVYGDHPEDCYVRKGHPARRAKDVAHAQQAMGIDWMPLWSELKEAIPPAYTEWIGLQLMQHLKVAV